MNNAIVLAGGLSSRMGQDKALIPIQGIPLLQRVCQVAHCCAESVYVVTPWIERYAALRDALPFVEWIAESRLPTTVPHPMVGFLQGLEHLQLEHLQLEHLETDWVLLLACDLPNLDAEVLQQWSRELPLLSETVIACLGKNPAGWWEPLCGFYRRCCRTQIAALVNQEQLSFQRWLNQQVVQELTVPDPRMLLNCNSPEDIE